MPDASDMDLLREFAGNQSETVFTELVHRHINLVYSVAMRFTGNESDAQDVTQAVFIILAKKAAGLPAKTNLIGWLYETTRFTAMSFLRNSARRRLREHEAHMQSDLNQPDEENAWQHFAPHLEEAMAGLNEKDRALLALRYFSNKSGTETATLLGIKEWAVHKRTSRALEKLRKFFSRRGLAFTTATIATAISVNSVQAAPTMLANSISAVAVAKGAAASGSTLTIIKGALKLMAWSKAKTAVVAVVGVLFAAGTTTVVIQHVRAEASATDSDKLWRIADIGSDTVAKLPPETKILPTLFLSPKNFSQGAGADSEKFVGIGQPVINIVYAAYDWPQSRIIFTDGIPAERYDFIATLSQGSRLALQQELKRTLGLTARVETREMDVLLLETRNANAPGLHKPVKGSYSYLNYSNGQAHIKWANQPLSKIIGFLESGAKMPILDKTTNTGNYSIDLTWSEAPGDDEHQALQKALLEQLGLQLVPAPNPEPVDMLVVDKVK